MKQTSSLIFMTILIIAITGCESKADREAANKAAAEKELAQKRFGAMKIEPMPEKRPNDSKHF
jgi:hypothetical protein